MRKEVFTMSDFLFARPSIIEGIARIIDISGSLQVYNECLTANKADSLAIYNDFKAVGMDIRNAAAEFEKEVAVTK
jgi:hypothetical protein